MQLVAIRTKVKGNRPGSRPGLWAGARLHYKNQAAAFS